jgi:hypothetical protein
LLLGAFATPIRAAGWWAGSWLGAAEWADGDSGPAGADLAIGAAGRLVGTATPPNVATRAAARANGAPCFAAAAWLPVLAVMLAAVRVVVPVLASEPVAAIAGLADTPAITAASAAPAVMVASRVVLLADPMESRRCVWTARNGGILTCGSNVSLSAGVGGTHCGHPGLGRPGCDAGLRLGGTRCAAGQGDTLLRGQPESRAWVQSVTES